MSSSRCSTMSSNTSSIDTSYALCEARQRDRNLTAYIPSWSGQSREAGPKPGATAHPGAAGILLENCHGSRVSPSAVRPRGGESPRTRRRRWLALDNGINQGWGQENLPGDGRKATRYRSII
jgi:hypothetical protein